MNLIKRHIARLISTALMLTVLLTACVADEELPPCPPSDTATSYYLTLRFQLADANSTRDGSFASGYATTRAGNDKDYDPINGNGSSEHPEDSDKDNTNGLISATDLENNIKNVTIFFVDLNCDLAKDKNIDNNNLALSQLDLPFVAALYVDFTTPGTRDGVTVNAPEKTVKVKVTENKTVKNKAYAMVAVANMGDLSSGNKTIENIFTDADGSAEAATGEGITSLHKLRAYITSAAWEDVANEAVKKTNFAMSSFLKSGVSSDGGVLSEVKGEGSGLSGSEDQPFSASCYLMRLAARIDIGCSESGGIYGNLDKTNGEIVYTAYDKTEEGKSEIGTVYLQAAEITNQIQTPSFALRHTIAATDLSKIAGKTVNLYQDLSCGGLLTRNSFIENAYVVDPNFTAKITSPEGYALSTLYGTTRPADIETSLREKYQAIMAGNGSGESSDNSGYFGENALVKHFINNDADDHDKNNLGFSKAMTVGYVNENTYDNSLDDQTEKAKANANYATGLALKAVFVPTTVYRVRTDGDPVISEGETTPEVGAGFIAVEGFEKNTTFHMWRGKIGDVEKSYFFDSLTAANKFAASHSGGDVKSYLYGVGYYSLFIEHADQRADAQSPMKHGIVRNNVYRVLLQFTGPGTTYYEETPQDVDWHIYTRDWNQRIQPEIVM